MTLHICWFLCTWTGSHHGPWNTLVLYLGETIGVQPTSIRRLTQDFYKLLSVFAMLHTPHMPKLCMPTFGNRRNNSKTAPISLYCVRLPSLRQPEFVCISASFRALNTCVTYWITSLFHIWTIFVHVGPTSMLINRPSHGPWTVNVSGRFLCVSFPVSNTNVVSGVSGRTYSYQLFKATIRHPTS